MQKRKNRLTSAGTAASVQQMQQVATVDFELVARDKWLFAMEIGSKIDCLARGFGQKVLQSVVKCCVVPGGAIENEVLWVQLSVQQTISCCTSHGDCTSGGPDPLLASPLTS
jgi:hypothetical protein